MHEGAGLEHLQPGRRVQTPLEVLATDPGAVADFQAFCRQTKHELVSHSEAGGVYTFHIKRTA